MSRPFESFEFLNRGWDNRFLENQSLRSAFVALLVASSMLGLLTFMMLYSLLRLHHFNWTTAILLPVFVIAAGRYSVLIYRRLGRS